MVYWIFLNCSSRCTPFISPLFSLFQKMDFVDCITWNPCYLSFACTFDQSVAPTGDQKAKGGVGILECRARMTKKPLKQKDTGQNCQNLPSQSLENETQSYSNQGNIYSRETAEFGKGQWVSWRWNFPCSHPPLHPSMVTLTTSSFKNLDGYKNQQLSRHLKKQKGFAVLHNAPSPENCHYFISLATSWERPIPKAPANLIRLRIYWVEKALSKACT